MSTVAAAHRSGPTPHHDAELEELMDYFKFALHKDTAYRGTVAFNLEYPNGRRAVKTVRVTDHGAEVFNGLPPDGKITGQCSLDRQLFVDLYWGRVHPQKAFTSGKLKVHDWAYREFYNFGYAFSFESAKWKEFYEYRSTLPPKSVDEKLTEEVKAAFAVPGWWGAFSVGGLVRNLICSPAQAQTLPREGMSLWAAPSHTPAKRTTASDTTDVEADATAADAEVTALLTPIKVDPDRPITPLFDRKVYLTPRLNLPEANGKEGSVTPRALSPRPVTPAVEIAMSNADGVVSALLPPHTPAPPPVSIPQTLKRSDSTDSQKPFRRRLRVMSRDFAEARASMQKNSPVFQYKPHKIDPFSDTGLVIHLPPAQQAEVPSLTELVDKSWNQTRNAFQKVKERWLSDRRSPSGELNRTLPPCP